MPDATAYEVQMGSMEGGWQTISPGFKSTLLRKKGERFGRSPSGALTGKPLGLGW